MYKKNLISLITILKFIHFKWSFLIGALLVLADIQKVRACTEGQTTAKKRKVSCSLVVVFLFAYDHQLYLD